MHWIEQLFHVEPDAGSGTAEFMIFLVVITAAMLSLQRLHRSRFRRLRRTGPPVAPLALTLACYLAARHKSECGCATCAFLTRS